MRNLLYLLSITGLSFLLGGCGLHFRNKTDYPQALWNIKFVSNINNQRLSNQFQRQLRSIGFNLNSNRATSTITLISYKFHQDNPTISDDTTPIYSTSTANLCFKVNKTHSKTTPFSTCTVASNQHIVTTSSAFNPSTVARFKQELNQAVIIAAINRLQNKDVRIYLEQKHAK